MMGLRRCSERSCRRGDAARSEAACNGCLLLDCVTRRGLDGARGAIQDAGHIRLSAGRRKRWISSHHANASTSQALEPRVSAVVVAQRRAQGPAGFAPLDLCLRSALAEPWIDDLVVVDHGNAAGNFFDACARCKRIGAM